MAVDKAAAVADQNANNAAVIAAKLAPPLPKYGPVTFLKPEGSKVFTDRRGNKAAIAAQCKIPVPYIGLTIETAVWARLEQSPTGFEVTFEASLPARAFARSNGEADDVAKADFLAHVENSLPVWLGWEAASNAAVAKLTGKPVVMADKRPRLVMSVKPVTGEQAPTA